MRSTVGSWAVAGLGGPFACPDSAQHSIGSGSIPNSLVQMHLAALPRCPYCCAGLPERLEVQLAAGGQSLVLAAFELQELELDSALALLEHLVEEEEEAAA